MSRKDFCTFLRTAKNYRFLFARAVQPDLLELGQLTLPIALIPAPHHQNLAAILLLILLLLLLLLHCSQPDLTSRTGSNYLFFQLRCTWQAERSCSPTVCKMTVHSEWKCKCVFMCRYTKRWSKAAAPIKLTQQLEPKVTANSHRLNLAHSAATHWRLLFLLFFPLSPLSCRQPSASSLYFH